jgi:hypothetical protein
MEPIKEFTEEMLGYWREYEYTLATFSAPAERELGIEPALGIVTKALPGMEELGHVVRVAWRPSEIDVVHLAHGGILWLSSWGGLPAHQLEVAPPPGLTPDKPL